MSELIIYGNLNQYTFANSIVAAQRKSLELFKENLTNIYVMHSLESYSELNQKKYLFSWNKIPGSDNLRLIEFLSQKFHIDWIKTAKIEKIDDGKTIIVTNGEHFLSLRLNEKENNVSFEIDDFRSNGLIVKMENGEPNIYKKNEWLDHIMKNGVSDEALIHRIVNINSTSESIEKFTEYLESIINGIDKKDNLIVDLTNGTTLHKTLLATSAFVLDLKNIFMIDVTKLSEITKEKGFINSDILERVYIQTPDNSLLDNIAYINLTEVYRYKKIISTLSERYSTIDSETSNKEFFEDNLSHSIKLKLSGDQKEKSDNAIYRIASSSITASHEDLIRVLINRFIKPYDSVNPNYGTFGNKLRQIQTKIEKEASKQFDVEFLKRFNEFILYLRNSTTHKGKIFNDVEKFKADLSVKMAIPFIQYYTTIVFPELEWEIQDKSSIKIKKLSSYNIKREEKFYFGLDGDDTGTKLEHLFLSSIDEKAFKKFSTSVETAIQEICKYIKNCDTKSTIIFATGDDLLFEGQFTEEELKKMQKIYRDKTLELTCSIGYGKSFKEVYLAMKIAKTEPGKDSIVGIVLE